MRTRLVSGIIRGLHAPAPSLDLHGRPARLAVVGAGPAGFYATAKLFSLPGSHNVRVDMFEELPAPFGLVRYGVAPDHPEVKNCQHKFEEVAEDPRFRYFGNVQVGAAPTTTTTTFEPPSPHVHPTSSRLAAEMPIDYLREHYDATLLTYGASFDRPLRIPGELDLDNILSARDFVHLYNGHPYAHLPRLDLSRVEHVTIIGQGNVALDCARILLMPVDQLVGTDIPEPILAELARSRVRRVDVVGRRGPAQLAGTTKELREMLNLPGVGFHTDGALLQQAQQQVAEMPAERARKRLLALMADGAKTPASGDKSWSLQFLLSPAEFRSDDASVAAARELLSPPPVKEVIWAVNELHTGTVPQDARAVPTGDLRSSPTDLVLKSVGYRSIGIPGLPFDDRLGVVSNDHGRVCDASGQHIPGLYCAGWLARGPTGVIATTMFEAYLTAEIIAGDLSSSEVIKPKDDPMSVEDLLTSTGPFVSWSQWKDIDREERERGHRKGKTREKIVSISEMLNLLER